ncbi:MAG: cytochrome c3 family protein [Anaeromyxobacteraceae bacterium]
MRPAKLAVTLAAALAACAGPRLARRPAPPPKSAWVAYPEAEVRDVKNAHEYKGAPLCQRCHASPGGKLVVEDEAALCYQCHHAAKMTHVGKIQSPLPKTLPFEEGGRIVCHTCHEPHDVKAQSFGFRAPYVQVCLECHKRH